MSRMEVASTDLTPEVASVATSNSMEQSHVLLLSILGAILGLAMLAAVTGLAIQRYVLTVTDAESAESSSLQHASAPCKSTQVHRVNCVQRVDSVQEPPTFLDRVSTRHA
jgi:hypothetical protein